MMVVNLCAWIASLTLFEAGLLGATIGTIHLVAAEWPTIRDALAGRHGERH